jgi:hypothetical protein
MMWAESSSYYRASMIEFQFEAFHLNDVQSQHRMEAQSFEWEELKPMKTRMMKMSMNDWESKWTK